MLKHKFTRLTAKQTALAKQYAAQGVPRNAINGLAIANAESVLANIEGPHIITDRYLAGESIIKIAASLHVSHIAVYDYLWRTIPEKWPKIRAARAEGQYDGAVESLSEDNLESLDGLKIARAREVARFRFGEMAALRREFSQKQEVTTNVQPVMNIMISVSPGVESSVQIGKVVADVPNVAAHSVYNLPKPDPE